MDPHVTPGALAGRWPADVGGTSRGAGCGTSGCFTATAARRGSPPVGSDLVFARLVLVDVPARRRSCARRRASCARAGRYFPRGRLARARLEPAARGMEPAAGSDRPLRRGSRCGSVHRPAAAAAPARGGAHRRPPPTDRVGLRAGNERRPILFDVVDNVDGPLVAWRLMWRAALSRQRAALRRHLDDPEALVVSYLFMQA
jgi:hypothetical protein